MASASKTADEKFMRMAIEATKKGICGGQTPFGACIVKAGKPVVCAHNVVWKTTDITAHGEINAIRLACKKLRTIDLRGCTIYSTTEPCPMCFSAIHWANFRRIVYGASIADAKKAGFHELTISDKRMRREGGSKVEVEGGLLKEECKQLFALWKSAKKCRVY
jgi:guanine deaminase